MTTLRFFQAEWCGPCKQQKPIVEQLAEDHPEVDIEEHDIEEDTELTNKYQVRSVPTIIIENDDQVVGQFTGLTQENELAETLSGE